jgi:hypothetical protein
VHASARQLLTGRQRAAAPAGTVVALCARGAAPPRVVVQVAGVSVQRRGAGIANRGGVNSRSPRALARRGISRNSADSAWCSNGDRSRRAAESEREVPRGGAAKGRHELRRPRSPPAAGPGSSSRSAPRAPKRRRDAGCVQPAVQRRGVCPPVGVRTVAARVDAFAASAPPHRARRGPPRSLAQQTREPFTLDHG